MTGKLYIPLLDSFSRERKTVDSKKSTRTLLIISATILVLHLAAHAPFLITDYFGEQDAARIVVDSIKASYNGDFHDLEYPIHSSPLYSDVIRLLIQYGLISYSHIPFWMAIVSLIASAVITIAMLIFVFRLTSSFTAAIIAALFLQGIPVFWFSSIYGFPTIVALAFFVLSLILFQSAIDDKLSKFKYFLILGSLVMFVLAVMTKIDVLLASAIFCLPVWKAKRSFKTKLVWILCLALFTGFVFFLFNQYAEILINPSQESRFFVKRFNSVFPSQFSNLYTRKHFSVVARAAGLLTIPAALLSLTLIGWRREWKATFVWFILVILPLFLFWGMKPDETNLARHYLVPYFFLCIIIALPLSYSETKKWIWAAFLGFVCLLNYSSLSPRSSLRYPSGQLLASTRLFEARVKDLHSKGKIIANLPYEKVAVIGKKWMHPYFRFEMLRSSKLSYVSHVSKDKVQNSEMQNKKKNRTFLWLNSAEIPEIAELIEQGYFTVICNERHVKDLRNSPALKDKWVYIGTPVRLTK